MKFRLLTVFAAMVVLITSCSKLPGDKKMNVPTNTKSDGKDFTCIPPVDSSCILVLCDASFSEIQLELADANGNPVILDTFYTEDTLGNKMPRSLYSYDSVTATYVVFNDSWLWLNRNKSVKMRFVGIKNGKKVVDEMYDIISDCCHVTKVSGKDKVVLP